MPHDNNYSDEDSDEDSDEPLSLNMETLAALQSVMGMSNPASSNQDGDALLAQLLQSRRIMHDDSDSDNDDSKDDVDENDVTSMRKGESHKDYYRRLYPERYEINTQSEDNNNSNDRSEQRNLRIEHPVALITMEDEYVQNLILSAFEKRSHWNVMTQLPSSTNDNLDNSDGNNANNDTINHAPLYNFHWGEYEHIDWFSTAFTSEETIVSCYYNRKGMIRKGNLASILEKWKSKYKGIKKPLTPKSYVLILPLPKELGKGVGGNKEDFSMDHEFIAVFEQSLYNSGFPGFSHDAQNDKDEYEETNRQMSNKEHDQVYILKPSITNQANGISLVRSKTQLQNAIYKADEIQKAGDFVLQQYIPPLLLDGRKFHLRVFMLLHGNITAYIYPDFLAIFSLEPYQNADLDNTRAHLTNIAHQQVLSLDDQHRCMRRFDETKQDMIDARLVSTMEEAHEKIQLIQNRVYEIAGEMVEACTSELTFVCKRNCFELFGLDFMIDPDWNTWLLEANAEPDLSKAGDRLQCVIDHMLEETLEVVVDSNPRFRGCDDDNDETNSTTFVKVFERKGRSF